MSIRAHLRAVLFVSLTIPAVFAQGERGTITGTVTDSSGAIVPQANVTLRSVSTNISSRSESNNSGIYVFPP